MSIRKRPAIKATGPANPHENGHGKPPENGIDPTLPGAEHIRHSPYALRRPGEVARWILDHQDELVRSDSAPRDVLDFHGGTTAGKELSGEEMRACDGTSLFRGVPWRPMVDSNFRLVGESEAGYPHWVGGGTHGDGNYHAGMNAIKDCFRYANNLRGWVYHSKLFRGALAIDEDDLDDLPDLPFKDKMAGKKNRYKAIKALYYGYDVIHVSGRNYYSVLNKNALAINLDTLPGTRVMEDIYADTPPSGMASQDPQETKDQLAEIIRRKSIIGDKIKTIMKAWEARKEDNLWHDEFDQLTEEHSRLARQSDQLQILLLRIEGSGIKSSLIAYLKSFDS